MYYVGIKVATLYGIANLDSILHPHVQATTLTYISPFWSKIVRLVFIGGPLCIYCKAVERPSHSSGLPFDSPS